MRHLLQQDGAGGLRHMAGGLTNDIMGVSMATTDSSSQHTEPSTSKPRKLISEYRQHDPAPSADDLNAVWSKIIDLFLAPNESATPRQGEQAQPDCEAVP